MDFSTANDLWRLRQEVTIDLHTVQHLRFFEFSHSSRRILAKIEAAYSHELFWQRYNSALKRIRFDLAANPVSFAIASASVTTVVRDLCDGLKRRAKVYPDVTEDAITLLKAVKALVTSNDAPLLEYLYFTQLLDVNEDAGVALVVRESRYLPTVKSELLALDIDNVDALTPSRLKSSERFERLVCIGPTAWFPDHVVGSPRAPDIAFVRFDWLGPDRPPRPLRPGPGEGTWEAQGFSKPRSSASTTRTSTNQPMLDIVPRIDWNLMLNELPEGRFQTDGDSESVPARLCALEGGVSVFLRGHDGAETSVLYIDQKQADVIWRPVSSLEPGDFLLLRTTGGGDYVTELAWEYLGEKAREIQNAQAHWKRKLSNVICARDAEEVSEETKDNGASAANVGNILAWASDDRIQPGKKGDFIALLKTLGLCHKAEEYWLYGRAIRRARVRAGLYVRKLLLEQVQEADIELLEENGGADFELPGRHGGTVSALRLYDLAPQVVRVPAHRIGILLEVAAQ